MDWDKLKIFHAVTQAGSFTKAGEVLNLSQSAISRQIQSLEYELKCSLFQRHARGLSLTENGETLYKTANEVISKIKEVETDLVERKDKPTHPSPPPWIRATPGSLTCVGDDPLRAQPKKHNQTII